MDYNNKIKCLSEVYILAKYLSDELIEGMGSGKVRKILTWGPMRKNML